MSIELGIILTLAGVIITYLAWKQNQFRPLGEIENSVQQSFNDYRVFDRADFAVKSVGVLAEKPGFPERLYKYIPLAQREGFVDVRLFIEPFEEEEVVLPDPDSIEDYEYFSSELVEIRNVTWDGSPIGQENMLIRVHSLNPTEIVNATHLSIVCIYEVKTGDVDEDFHSQFRRNDIE